MWFFYFKKSLTINFLIVIFTLRKGNNMDGMQFNNKASGVDEITPNVQVPANHGEFKQFIKNSTKLRPKGLIMPDLKWKYLIRQALRGKNIMLTGASGSGKTLAASIIPKILGRPHELFNIGQCQDAVSYLIGNTHFRDNSTIFDESLFVKMIQIENAVIILDEMSRGNSDAWNILMPVLDVNQRYLRLDASPNSPTIKVANGVTFIATANVGAEYTATKTLDRALSERFVYIEMDILNDMQEYDLLKYMYPHVNETMLHAIADIAFTTRMQMRSDNPKISSFISTRQSVEMASLIFDGFSLSESAEACVYSFYPTDGGNDSERTFIKSVVQKYIDIDEQTDGYVKTDSDLFTSNDYDNAAPNQ